LGCVLANTNLNVLTAVFYWFTLKRDEPFFIPVAILNHLYCILIHPVAGLSAGAHVKTSGDYQ
ncbi:TPA: hypothetical protein ACNIQF_005540, partial [Serratia marcescens]